MATMKLEACGPVECVLPVPSQAQETNVKFQKNYTGTITYPDGRVEHWRNGALDSACESDEHLKLRYASDAKFNCLVNALLSTMTSDWCSIDAAMSRASDLIEDAYARRLEKAPHNVAPITGEVEASFGPRTDEPAAFAISDPVRLKSGGPVMYVEEIGADGKLRCRWTKPSGLIDRAVFDPECVEPAEEQ